MPFNVDWRGLDPFRPQTDAQKKKRQYKQHEQLGEGGFGRVLRAEWRDPAEPGVKKQVALKIIDKARVNEALPVTAEIAVLQKLKHEHIVRLYDSFETKHSFYLAFELATGGELFERVRRGKFTETNAANCMQQILSGIAYLHENRIVHRDIKPENIMYRTRAPDSPIVIVDFGIAKSIDNLTDADGLEGDSDSEEEEAKRGGVRQIQVMGGEEAASNMAGTFGYASPEALKGKRPACKMDMWSIGVIAFRILAGYPPFRARSKEEMIRVTLKGRIQFHEEHWVRISDPARDFVKALMVVKPENRLSAEEALRHPWLVANAPALATPSTATSLSAPSTATSSSLDQSTVAPSAPPSRRNSAFPPRSLPDTPESALIALPDKEGVTTPGTSASHRGTNETSDSYLSSNGPVTPAQSGHARNMGAGPTEDEESDDEGFYTPDEGDDEHTQADGGAVRNRSRKSMRRKGQVPDASKTLAVGTAVLPEAQAQAGMGDARPMASRTSSKEASPTDGAERGKKGGGLGLKGMMGKLGIGAAGK